MENINQAEEFMKLLWQFNRMRSERNIPQPDKGCMAVMSTLFVHKEMYAHQLAKELGLSRARLSSIVKTLKAKKLITCRLLLTDKRKILIKMTDEGKRLVDETYQRIIGRVTKIFDKLGIEKSKVSLEILKDILKIYEDDKEGELLGC